MKDKKRSEKGFALGGFILEFMQSIVLALAVFIFLYMFIAQPNEVKGSSMYPNFENGDFLLTDKLSYFFGQPQRGDVVVFRAPSSEPCAEEQCDYIKRIIGVPGDKVMVKNGKVFLNGQQLDQSFLPNGIVTDSGAFSEEGSEKTIPDGTYLVFGDNRPHSRDGREFGPIKRDSIIGKAFLKYWPPRSIGIVPSVKF